MEEPDEERRREALEIRLNAATGDQHQKIEAEGETRDVG